MLSLSFLFFWMKRNVSFTQFTKLNRLFLVFKQNIFHKRSQFWKKLKFLKSSHELSKSQRFTRPGRQQLYELKKNEHLQPYFIFIDHFQFRRETVCQFRQVLLNMVMSVRVITVHLPPHFQTEIINKVPFAPRLYLYWRPRAKREKRYVYACGWLRLVALDLFISPPVEQIARLLKVIVASTYHPAHWDPLLNYQSAEIKLLPKLIDLSINVDQITTS